MAAVDSQPEQLSGKLVAVEGDANLISTQLLLLPPSQKILILPSLVESLPTNPAQEKFNARSFVRDVHSKFTDRTKIARTFLSASTASHPRLVFMNGGSVAARTVCISRICENLTNGDVQEAETLFDEIIQTGIAGLMRPEDVTVDQDAGDELERGDEPLSELDDIEEDPTSKAMKAADSLDRETALLEGEHTDLETRSVGAGHDGRATPKRNSAYVSRAVGEDKVGCAPDSDAIVRTVLTVPTGRKGSRVKSEMVGSDLAVTPPFTAGSQYSYARSHQSEDCNADDEDEEGEEDEGDEDEEEGLPTNSALPTPDFGTGESMPHTPVVVYGEAQIVDVQSLSPSTPRNEIRKVRSMDRFHLDNASIRAEDDSIRPPLFQSKSALDLRVRPDTSIGKENRRSAFFQSHRGTFVKAAQTTIKRSSGTGSPMLSSLKADIRVFVDRGTDAGEGPIEQVNPVSQTDEKSLDEPFEPVLGLLEDLVIHFTSDTSDAIFQRILLSYRNGNYLTPESAPDVKAPPSPAISSLSTDGQDCHQQAEPAEETDDETYRRPEESDEFDPYSSHNNYSQIQIAKWPVHKSRSLTDSGVQDMEPSTPPFTPPPASMLLASKFHDFTPVNGNNTIAIQNSFRAFLSLLFPPGDNGYSQHYFPASADSERLWKPVWRKDEDASIGNEGRTVDQIIALGCEDGVKKDFFSVVAAQVERLGIKRDGLNRSGRLDLNYLISNAVQTVSRYSLNPQDTTNPLSNPVLLATLLIPQIEAYLATNDSVRLLIITYSSAHLATIIALRKLLGQDVLKVAGILDSLSSDPPSFGARPRTSSSSHPLSNQATASVARKTSVKHSHANSLRSLSQQTSFHQSTASESAASFSKANYLLPSIATDAEITTFLSGIWKSLIDKSPFYTPEPEPAPVIVEKIVERIVERPAPPPPPTPTPSHPPVSFRQGKEPRESKISRLTGGDVPTPRSRGHAYAASTSSTIRTTNSERARKDKRNDDGWGNFYVGEEDSDDDAYDRMIMGRSGARIVPEVKQIAGKKRSSKKALKWLGLA